jgi:hypothetical protein
LDPGSARGEEDKALEGPYDLEPVSGFERLTARLQAVRA